MADLLPVWKRVFGYVFDIVPRGKIALDENTYAFNKLLARHAPDTFRLSVPGDVKG